MEILNVHYCPEEGWVVEDIFENYTEEYDINYDSDDSYDRTPESEEDDYLPW